MKIFQLIQKPQLRGAEIFASQLSENLQGMGHDVTLISLFTGDARLPFSGTHTQFKRPLSKRLVDWRGWRMLANKIKVEQPDLVQANAGDTLKYVVMSKLLFGWKAPIVYRNANLMSDFIDSKLKFYLNRYLLRQVAHIISVSNNCSNDLKDFFDLPVTKLSTVEIGINLTKVGSLPVDVKLIFQQRPVFLNVASMVPEKNQKGLLRIFSLIRKKLPAAQLIIIGRGKLEGELRQLVVALDLTDCVHFLGYRDDVIEIMQYCDAFLLPSLIEGLPGVVLEAMYARCPVVAYDVGGISEVITDRISGKLVKKGEEEVFVEAMLELIKKEGERSHIIKSAFEKVTVKFDNRNIAARFLDLYQYVVNDKR